MKEQEPNGSTRRTLCASLAAVGSIVLASTCCLPIVPFLFAAGAAGTSVFLARLRPFLMGASVLFIGFGFYQSWRAKKCKCRTGLLSTILLWFSLVVVLALLFFPQAIANLLADIFQGAA